MTVKCDREGEEDDDEQSRFGTLTAADSWKHTQAERVSSSPAAAHSRLELASRARGCPTAENHSHPGCQSQARVSAAFLPILVFKKLGRGVNVTVPNTIEKSRPDSKLGSIST